MVNADHSPLNSLSGMSDFLYQRRQILPFLVLADDFFHALEKTLSAESWLKALPQLVYDELARKSRPFPTNRAGLGGGRGRVGKGRVGVGVGEGSIMWLAFPF
jgi:hypothetical protein